MRQIEDVTKLNSEYLNHFSFNPYCDHIETEGKDTFYCTLGKYLLPLIGLKKK